MRTTFHFFIKLDRNLKFEAEEFVAWQESLRLTKQDVLRELGISDRSYFRFRNEGKIMQPVAMACCLIKSKVLQYPIDVKRECMCQAVIKKLANGDATPSLSVMDDGYEKWLSEQSPYALPIIADFSIIYQGVRTRLSDFELIKMTSSDPDIIDAYRDCLEDAQQYLKPMQDELWENFKNKYPDI